MARQSDFLHRLYQLFKRWQSLLSSKPWLKFLITGGILLFGLVYIGYYLVRDWKIIREITFQFDLTSFILAWLVYAINFYVLLFAWHVLVKSFNCEYKLSQNAYYYAYSFLYKFLPTPSWFLVSRVYLYGQTGMRKRTALSITLLETILHVITGCLVYCLLLINAETLWTWLYFLGALMAGWILLIILEGGFARLDIEINHVKQFKRHLPGLMGLFFLTWVVAGPFFWLLMRSVIPDIPVDISVLMRIWIASNLVSYVGAYTLGGIGIFRELTLMFLLGPVLGVPIALLVTVITRLVMTLAGIFWALITIAALQVVKIVDKKRRQIV